MKTEKLIVFAALLASALLGGAAIYYVVKHTGPYSLPDIMLETPDGRPFALSTLRGKMLFMVLTVAYVKYKIWLRWLVPGRAGLTALFHQKILVRIIFLSAQTRASLLQATLLFLSGRHLTVCTPTQR